MAQFVGTPGRLRTRKRLTSVSKPSHQTRRRMRKLFIRVKAGRQWVTDQRVKGFPRVKGQSDTGRWPQSSRKAEYSSESNSPFNHLLQADLLQFPSIVSGSEGRLCCLSSEQKTGRDPFVGDAQNLLTSTCLGRKSGGSAEKACRKFSCHWWMREAMQGVPIRCKRAREWQRRGRPWMVLKILRCTLSSILNSVAVRDQSSQPYKRMGIQKEVYIEL